jgi:predicted acylesterase/phospholipase RssA
MKYNGIVLSGGAAKGFYQLGALNYLKSIGSLDELKYFAGTSVGSVIALLLALDFTPLEICSYVCKHDINDNFNIDLNLFNLIEKWGLIDRARVYQYVSDMIKSRYSVAPTFEELKLKGKIFICTAYCLNGKNKNVYFSYKTHSSMNTLDAVMLSINIPVLFSKAEWEGCLYVDGGLFDRLPAQYVFDFAADEWDIPELAVIDTYTAKKSEMKSFQEYLRALFMVPLDSQLATEYEKTGMHYFRLECKEGLLLKLSVVERIRAFCQGSCRMAQILGDAIKQKAD